MMKKVSLNFTFNVLSIIVFCAATAFAQTNVCAMRIDVTNNDGEAKIAGATATALNKKTKRVYRAVLAGGNPYFAKLPGGDYRFTVAKIGFKQSINDFSFNCSKAINVRSIELYKGSSRQIVKLYEANSYSVSKIDPNNILRAEPVESNKVPADSDSSGSGTVGGSQRGKNVSRIIEGGVINGKATNLVKPAYPAAARAVKASGAVNVQVTIDEAGNVISAQAVSGHPLLRAAAVQAARASTFSTTLLSGQPVKVTGIIVYNFVP